jgi:nicotinic acid phosphoribosyltransferase
MEDARMLRLTMIAIFAAAFGVGAAVLKNSNFTTASLMDIMTKTSEAQGSSDATADANTQPEEKSVAERIEENAELARKCQNADPMTQLFCLGKMNSNLSPGASIRGVMKELRGEGGSGDGIQ